MIEFIINCIYNLKYKILKNKPFNITRRHKYYINNTFIIENMN